MIFEIVRASVRIDQFIVLVLYAAATGAILVIARLWWNLLRQIAFDCVSIYVRASTAKERQKAELELWQLRGRAMIEDRRLALQAGIKDNWEAGVYNVLIDEVSR